MLFQIYLQNGPLCPWLALQTTKKEEAEKFLESAKAQFVYLRILDENGSIISMKCQPDHMKGL